MIEAIRKIGETKRNELDKSNFKEKFLQKLSNPIKAHYEREKKIKGKKSKGEQIPIKKIILNLNIEKKEIEIDCDKDISSEKQLVFSPASPNGKKIDFNTNYLKYHIENTVPDLISFIPLQQRPDHLALHALVFLVLLIPQILLHQHFCD